MSRKIKFLMYDKREVYEKESKTVTTNIISNSRSGKRKIVTKNLSNTFRSGFIILQNIEFKKINDLKLLINIYNPNDPLTDYNNFIHHPKLKDSLFLFLSNNYNSGYAGGDGYGTAAIGKYEGTYGVITGYYNKDREPISFDSIDDKDIFQFIIRNDHVKYLTTARKAIDYLIEQLYMLIIRKKYKSIIIPGDYNSSGGFTIGSGVFRTHESVRQYIYDKIRSFAETEELLNVNAL